jgi:predicted transcriptional regulator
MKQQDIKQLLHESIENINDEDFLIAVKQIIDRKYSPLSEPKLSECQLARIKESREQINNGKFLTNEQADSLVDKWLSE